MSTIIADNLTGKTSAGDITVTSEGGAATQSLQQGLAKAWVNFDGVGTVAISDSFNMSSITDNATGQYRYTMSSAMSSYDYSVTFAQAVDDPDGSTDIWTNGFRSNHGCLPKTTTVVSMGLYDGVYVDCGYLSSVVLGDLA